MLIACSPRVRTDERRVDGRCAGRSVHCMKVEAKRSVLHSPRRPVLLRSDWYVRMLELLLLQVVVSHRPVGVATWDAPFGASAGEAAAFVGSLVGRRSAARVRGLPALPRTLSDWIERADSATIESHESAGEQTLLYWAASVRSNDGAAMRVLPSANASTAGRPPPQPLRRVRANPARLQEIGAKQRERFERTQNASLLRYYYAGVDPLAVLSPEEVHQSMPFRHADQSNAAPAQTLWFASCGTATQLHYDASDNLFRQLSGTKRFRLLSPASAAATELFSSFSPAQRQCRQPREFELHTRTAVSDACATIDLAPGEALFIPAYTLHHVSTPRDTALSVGLSTSCPSRPEALKDTILNSPVLAPFAMS